LKPFLVAVTFTASGLLFKFIGCYLSLKIRPFLPII